MLDHHHFMFDPPADQPATGPRWAYNNGQLLGFVSRVSLPGLLDGRPVFVAGTSTVTR